MKKVESMTTPELIEWNKKLTALLADEAGHGTMAWTFMVGGHLEKIVSSWLGVDSGEVVKLLKRMGKI
jgi:hypothetical protein